MRIQIELNTGKTASDDTFDMVIVGNIVVLNILVKRQRLCKTLGQRTAIVSNKTVITKVHPVKQDTLVALIFKHQ